MAKQFTVYNALLSSPGGMDADRQAVHSAVSEANAFLRGDGIQVDVRDWERDVRPSMGVDGQEVVNRQICNDSDLAFVLIHDRIGTPTPRAASGTVEEAEIMIGKKEKGERVDLMVFFRKPSITLNVDSLENLKKVLEFRTFLESKGVFWKEYADPESLSSLVRIHLPACIREISAKGSPDRPGLPVVAMPQGVVPEGFFDDTDVVEAELGSIDLEIQFKDAIEQVTRSLEFVSASTREMSEGITGETSALDRIGKSADRNPRDVRDSVNRAVFHLDAYSEKLTPEIPVIERSLLEVTESLIAIVSMSSSEFQGGLEDLENLQKTVRDTQLIVAGAIKGTQDQRDSLASLPRMTKELNAAKRRGVEVLNSLISAFSVFMYKTEEIDIAIQDRINKISIAD